MKVRDLILVIYGAALIALLADIAVRVKRETVSGTFCDDSAFSSPVWTVEI